MEQQMGSLGRTLILCCGVVANGYDVNEEKYKDSPSRRHSAKAAQRTEPLGENPSASVHESEEESLILDASYTTWGVRYCSANVVAGCVLPCRSSTEY